MNAFPKQGWFRSSLAAGIMVALALVFLTNSSVAWGQQPEPPQLVGSVWQGTESIFGKPTALSFRFLANGEVTVSAVNTQKKQITYHGKYTRQGNQITMDFPTYGFNATFHGTFQFQVIATQDSGTPRGVPADWYIQGHGDDHSQFPKWNFKVKCAKLGSSQ